MDAETIKKFKEAKGHIEIDVDGGFQKLKIKGCDSAALLAATVSLIKNMARLCKVTDLEVLGAIELFLAQTEGYFAESREQADVIQEILKSRTDK